MNSRRIPQGYLRVFKCCFYGIDFLVPKFGNLRIDEMSIKYLNWAFSLLDFKPIQKVILLSLADNSDDDGVSFPSIRQVCARTGIKSRTTVI